MKETNHSFDPYGSGYKEGVRQGRARERARLRRIAKDSGAGEVLVDLGLPLWNAGERRQSKRRK